MISGSGGNVKARQVDLPAALSVTNAQNVVQRLYLDQLAQLGERTLYLARVDPALRPGTMVRLADSLGLWRIARWGLENIAPGNGSTIACRLDLVRSNGGAWLLHGGSLGAGRSIRPPDYPASDIGWALHDLPGLPNQPATQRRLLAAAWPVAADGTVDAGSGWRHADIFRATQDGGLLHPLGRIRSPAAMGLALNDLPAASGLYFESAVSVDVDFGAADPQLESIDAASIDAGVNIAILDDELIQFCKVQWLGDGRYRLSEIYRALGDGRGAHDGHVAGARLILLDRALMPVESSSFAVDGASYFAATSPAASEPALLQVQGEPRALKPLSPVHLDAVFNAAGDLTLQWTRRDRHRPAWTDGPAGAMAESEERYRISFADDDAVNGEPLLAIFDSNRAEMSLEADQMADLRAAANGALVVSVQHIGDFAVSESARCTIG